MGARRPKTSTKRFAAPGGACARTLAEQLRDTTGAVRRIDHPRAAVRRLDLLRDDDLDVFRIQHGERADAAMDASVVLLEHLDFSAFEN